MPELPDVEVFRKEAEKIKNSGIRDIEIEDKKFVGLSKNDVNKLKDRKFKDVVRWGKYLFLPLNKSAALVLHFGMTGYLKYLEEEEKSPRFTKCTFVLKNKHKLHYISKRKLGQVEFTENLDDYIKEKELGKDALEMSENEFISQLEGKKSMIKTAITNQKIISGIGNVYADEILFQSKIHPKQSVANISNKDLKKVYKNIQKVLKKAIEKGGEVSELPKSYLLPKRKDGENCPGCKGKIEQIKISGRTTFFCPSCQEN